MEVVSAPVLKPSDFSMQPVLTDVIYSHPLLGWNNA
jgi:hypothetical protein